MAEPHVIRLRDPWERRLTLAESHLAERWFNKPTGLSESSRVHLVVRSPLSVHLNEQRLHHISPGVYDITPFLEPRNRLAIELASSPFVLEVQLEIYD